MEFENPLQLGDVHGTLGKEDTAEDLTKDTDVSKVDETLDTDTAKLETSSNKEHSTTYEKLKDERPSEEKIYDKLKKRRVSKYFSFQLPAKKYVFTAVAVIGIVVVVVLVLVITLASQKNEDASICEHPSEIQNGEVKNLTGLKQDNTFELHCKDGYRIAAESPEDVTDTNENTSLSSQLNDGHFLKRQQKINCLKNGQWSNTPRCEPVSCGKPIVPVHAHIVYIRGITYQSTVVISCRDGFEMVGKPFIVCQGNGTWSTSPSCGKGVDGGFSLWTSWNKCSVTCGYGSQNRSRSCNNPAPQFGGRDCEGDCSQLRICNISECPVDGGFTFWTGWGCCSVTCAQGRQMRTRACTNPKPQFGGADCVGQSSQEKTCQVAECPINGNFTLWTSWGKCSKTCNEGIQWRYRNCTNPAPQFNGADCVGDRSQGQTCKVAECPINGGFTFWTSWGCCSVTCAQGRQMRTRACTNPKPQFGGADCVGQSSQEKTCQVAECPINGRFTTWTGWSLCSRTCNEGIQWRYRYCTNPAPQHGGACCVGDRYQGRTCNIAKCPIAGGFTLWSSWSCCSKTCGDGTQKRSRSCSNPSPQNGGKNCYGSSDAVRTCKITDCTVVHGRWASWTSWGTCSNSFGMGVQVRFRYCNNPPPSNGGEYCVGESRQVKDCYPRY